MSDERPTIHISFQDRIRPVKLDFVNSARREGNITFVAGYEIVQNQLSFQVFSRNAKGERVPHDLPEWFVKMLENVNPGAPQHLKVALNQLIEAFAGIATLEKLQPEIEKHLRHVKEQLPGYHVKVLGHSVQDPILAV